MKNTKGFTLVELLVVLLIIAILAAIATPLYLQNANRARASEAVSAMGLIRQALRDHFINNSVYCDVVLDATDGNIQNGLPTSCVPASGVPTPANAGLAVDLGVAQYYSNAAFTVDAVPGTDTQFTIPDPVNFLIFADGSISEACVGANDENCAINSTQVSNIDLKMDNSGRIFVTYDASATPVVWQSY